VVKRRVARRKRGDRLHARAMVWLSHGAAQAQHSLCPVVLPGAYEPRATRERVLRQVVREHLDRFLREAAAATDVVGETTIPCRRFGRPTTLTPELKDQCSDSQTHPRRAPARCAWLDRGGADTRSRVTALAWS